MEPVLDAAWIEPGMHLTSVKVGELDAAVRVRCERLFIHWQQLAPEHLQLHGAGGENLSRAWPSVDKDGELAACPLLSDLLGGKVEGRQGAQQVTCFINNIGSGLQFAAVGAALLTAARDRGAGRELPGEWFTQDVHP